MVEIGTETLNTPFCTVFNVKIKVDKIPNIFQFLSCLLKKKHDLSVDLFHGAKQSYESDTYSIRKCKSNLALGNGPALVAATNVYLNNHIDNRIQAMTRDQFYQPIDSRNRLSIIWYPDNKKSEPTGPVNVTRVGWSKLELKR